jgi:hypothetical protein
MLASSQGPSHWPTAIASSSTARKVSAPKRQAPANSNITMNRTPSTGTRLTNPTVRAGCAAASLTNKKGT